MPRLKVSDNRRFLTNDDGTPFFYLGDTAWELFHRLNREEADSYLSTRAAQGYTVIQAVVLAEHEFDQPNPYGHLPLAENDPTRPNESYFEHVDYIVNKAASLGMRIGMLPTWGDKWNQKWGKGPELFTPENARVFGASIGRRYRDSPVIWILGGDRPVENENHAAIIRAMASGLEEGDGGAHLKSFHPMGQHSSAEYFHDEEWLDFNMLQSGHSRGRDNWRSVADDYARSPIKPCMDAEPGYEDHPNGFKAENGYLDEHDVRKSAYWALFAGAHGHTYGCHDIWQFYDPNRFPGVSAARTPWPEALHLPGAGQMRHAKNLILSRPFLGRIPDQSIVVGAAPDGAEHVAATRGADSSYAFIYTPNTSPITIDLDRISGDTAVAHWYDPRTGAATPLGTFPTGETRTFTPPAHGPGGDWVLVLDDAGKGYPAPGVLTPPTH